MNKSRKRLGFVDTVRAEILAKERHGWSRYAIAKAIGGSEGTLHAFVNGRCGASVETLDRIADLLGLVVTVDERRRKAPPKKRRRSS